MYVLDTNTVACFFRREGAVAERLLATPPSEIGIPTVVLYELEVGVEKSTSPRKRRAQLARFVQVVEILPFGPGEARAAARIRASLERSGTPIGPLDILIAGTVVARGATLVTRNVREFSRIPDLSVVDWYESG
jgi:tRNA(fMet)-specific endonuclease VapC